MDNRDKDMINAMTFIKEYCNDIDNVDGCRNCPMFDNCDGSDDRRFPYFWYIPEGLNNGET